jgi:4-cresol dehydrogenase (hydroxylating)
MGRSFIAPGRDEELKLALECWRQELGTSWVCTDRSSLDEAARATFSSENRPVAIILPENVDQVAACLRIATQYHIPVYAVSQGKNWGYGSRVAHVDGSVLLELRRLDRIRDFNEDLGYITVEPGVTQDQVVKYLKERGSRRVLSHPAAFGDVSLLGNLLERRLRYLLQRPLREPLRLLLQH